MTALDEEEVDRTAVREAAGASGPATRGAAAGDDRVEADATGRSGGGGDGGSMADTGHQDAKRELGEPARTQPPERARGGGVDAASSGETVDGAVADEAPGTEEVPGAEREVDAGAEPDDELQEPTPRPGMTPRQARRVRVVTSGVVMAAVAAALVIRLGNAPSLLVVGLYGIALILSGIAIVLSRRGRTRVATAVLGCGFVMVILAERMLPDGS